MLDPSTPKREVCGAFSQGRHPERAQAWPSGGIISPAPRPRITCPQLEGLTHKATFRQPQPSRGHHWLLEEKDEGPAPPPPGGFLWSPVPRAGFQAHLPTLDLSSLLYILTDLSWGWALKGLSCFFPQ